MLKSITKISKREKRPRGHLALESSPPVLYRISILNCGDSMTEEDEFNDNEARIEELEQRIEELESAGPARATGLSLGYAMGLSLAIVLSWSRNASILWCMLHGLCSWVYVVYFALTR